MTLYTLNSYSNIYINYTSIILGGKIGAPKKWDLGREHGRFTDLLKSIAKYHSAYAWEEANWDWRQNPWKVPGRKIARENTGLGIKSPLRGRPSHKNTDLIRSVQFSHSVVSNSSKCCGLHHSRPPCPSPPPELTQTHVRRVGDAMQPPHPLSSRSPPIGDAMQPPHPLSSRSPPIFSLSQHQGLSNESVLWIRWLTYWSFSLSISPSNEYSGLISFRMDWLDLLAVQETLKSLLQHHSSKASVLWCSPFFMVQLSHPYMTIGKTIALMRWSFVGKVMPVLFNMLSRLVMTFLPRSKCLLISWLQHLCSVYVCLAALVGELDLKWALITSSPKVCWW